MQALLKKIWIGNSFILSKSFLVVFVSLMANAFAYLFQLLTGRYFSLEEYGQLNALFSLSGIIPLAVGIFISATPKVVAEIKDHDYPNRISALFFTLLYFETGISLVIIGVMLLFSGFIGDYLNISNIDLIRIFSVAVAAGIFTTFLNPFLQGLLRFKAYSFSLFLTAALKLAVAVVVIYLQLDVASIFIGLTVTTLIMGLIVVLALRKNIVNKFGEFAKADFRKLIYYSLASSLGLIGLNMLQNIDLIEVKHFFDEATAGIYASTSVIGKIVFYAASPVGIVMLPICSEKYIKGENFIKPFASALAIALFVSGCITVGYMLFPEAVINILFGSRYLSARDLLPQYAFFTLTYTILYIVTLFLISISKFKASSLPMISVLVQYFGIKLFADSPSTVIYISTISILIVVIPMLFIVYNLYKAHGENEN